MLVAIPDVLTPEQVAHARAVLERGEWVDGRVTAGAQSAQAKNNLQVPEGSAAARELGDMILRALGTSELEEKISSSGRNEAESIHSSG